MGTRYLLVEGALCCIRINDWLKGIEVLLIRSFIGLSPNFYFFYIMYCVVVKLDE